MATAPQTEPAYCMGCDAECADDAALLAHARRCERHPLAAEYSRRVALEEAVQAFCRAEAALNAAARDRASTIEQWRALWAARDRLYELVGTMPAVVHVPRESTAAESPRPRPQTFSPNAPREWSAAERAARVERAGPIVAAPLAHPPALTPTGRHRHGPAEREAILQASLAGASLSELSHRFDMDSAQAYRLCKQHATATGRLEAWQRRPKTKPGRRSGAQP